MFPDVIGWAAAAVLFLTLGWQVYAQGREGRYGPRSRALFTGQTLASIGFVTYSWLVHDVVFIVVNAGILCTALLGEALCLIHRRR
jgi:hypothetical protein